MKLGILFINAQILIYNVLKLPIDFFCDKLKLSNKLIQFLWNNIQVKRGLW